MSSANDQTERAVTIRIARKYHRELRRIAVERELSNAQVLCLALDLLVRHEAEGGTYAG